MTTPYVRSPYKAAQQDLAVAAELQATIESERIARETFVSATADIQRAVLVAGAGLRDVEAALTCHCSCHPRISMLHERGASCPCQLSDAAREMLRNEALARLSALADWEDLDGRAEERQRAFAAVAATLGATIRAYGGMAPFTIHGVVEGRAFWFRERHDQWRVEIGPDEQPLADLAGVLDHSVIIVGEGPSTDIATGDAFEISALQIACNTVRRFLRRRECVHATQLLDGSPAQFCGVCGVELSEAEAWRIFTDGVPHGE